MIDVFYDPHMVADSGGYSPSSAKPRVVVEDWINSGLPIRVRSFAPVGRGEIAMAHDRRYVDDVLDLDVNNGHGNRSHRLAMTFYWTLGSHYAASSRALEVGVACSPTSGFHHAGWDFGGGFCTFNGLMTSAIKLMDEGRVRKVAIWDLDYHEPDGCEDIIERLGRSRSVRTLSNSYTESATVIFDEMDEHMAVLDAFEPDLVMYQAGADMFIDDPLGGAMTVGELRERDRIVFGWCKSRGVPVVVNLAGGYARESDGSIPTVLEIHRNTMLAAIEQFQGGKPWPDHIAHPLVHAVRS